MNTYTYCIYKDFSQFLKTVPPTQKVSKFEDIHNLC